MTREQRETIADSLQDSLDKQFLHGKLTQAEYDRRCGLLERYELGQVTLAVFFGNGPDYAITGML